jgi:hypothetical protein
MKPLAVNPIIRRVSLLVTGIWFLMLVTTFAIGQMRQEVAVPKKVAQQLAADNVDGELRAQAMDLNGDGRPELIIQGACSIVGNCTTWVMRRQKMDTSYY